MAVSFTVRPLILAARACESAGLLADLGLFVSSLADILGEHLLCGLGGEDSHALRDEVVDSVAVSNFYDIVFVPEIGDVLFQNDFHTLSSLFQ